MQHVVSSLQQVPWTIEHAVCTIEHILWRVNKENRVRQPARKQGGSGSRKRPNDYEFR